MSVPCSSSPAVGSWLDRTAADDLTVVVRRTLSEQIDSLDLSLRDLDTALASGSKNIPLVFRLARRQYKRMEGAIEFYAPALAAAFNSRRQEVDDDDAPPPSTLAASGFPALEVLLGPSRVANPDSARRILAAMQPLVARLRRLVPGLIPTAAQVVEIARLELARVSTLGIAGFDAPGTGEAIRESGEALEGVRLLLRVAGSVEWPRRERERRALDSTIARAVDDLRANPDFESFNRLAFIAVYAEPVAYALDSLRRAAGVTPIRIFRAWRAEAPSVFGANAFDSRAYTPSGAPLPSPELASLGRRLFNDPMLSGTGTRSCASCHDPGRAFADGVPRATSLVARGAFVARNTPTLINAALQPAQFADERSVTLEDQVLEVLRSPSEMASSVESAAGSVARIPSYRLAFARAFGDTSGNAVTALRIRQALAAFVRTLVSLDSRFDPAVRGDTAAMSGDERRGFKLFMGKAGCGTCHFAPLFSGNTPPLYLRADVELIGTPASSAVPTRLDSDSGRARIDRLAMHLRAFKTPSLRNVSVTAPYMHNGAFATLDDVLIFYERGEAGAALVPRSKTRPSPPTRFASRPRSAGRSSFLGSLTDTSRLDLPRGPHLANATR